MPPCAIGNASSKRIEAKCRNSLANREDEAENFPTSGRVLARGVRPCWMLFDAPGTQSR